MPALAQSHPSRRGLIHTYPVVAYFLIAYAFSWLIGGVLIASYHGLATAPTWLHYVSAFGPTAAAIIVTAALDGRAGLMDLWQRVVRADVGLRWWLVAAGTPLTLAIVAAAVYEVEQGALPDIALFGEVDYLGNIGALAALGLWIATYGFGEEIGWRGSGNSILMVALWHGLFDFVSASPVAAGSANAVLSIVVVTWVIIILWRARSDQRVLRADAPDH
ncbi:MAG: CPBP family intramembrane metalloprotease [Roseiflexus sp.]|nr:CPBP family intramembrane metalloprotease [Roseiflexus sp.]MDW8146324.1 CPBP family intramembrane glutamate endopeptidase [Roseiflexaceae bacterium]